MGVIVGGPDAHDNFVDKRDNYQQTKPATHNNVPLLGVLARLHVCHLGYNSSFKVHHQLIKSHCSSEDYSDHQTV